jgi:hypothetical protein
MASEIVLRLIGQLIKEANATGHQTSNQTRYKSVTVLVPQAQVIPLSELSTFGTLLQAACTCDLNIKVLEGDSEVARVVEPTKDCLEGLKDFVTEKDSWQDLQAELRKQLEGTGKAVKAFRAGRQESVKLRVKSSTLVLTQSSVVASLKCTNPKFLFASGDTSCAVLYVACFSSIPSTPLPSLSPLSPLPSPLSPLPSPLPSPHLSPGIEKRIQMQKMMLERAEANYKSQLAALDRAIVIKETLERKLKDSDVTILEINKSITQLNEARGIFRFPNI